MYVTFKIPAEKHVELCKYLQLLKDYTSAVGIYTNINSVDFVVSTSVFKLKWNYHISSTLEEGISSIPVDVLLQGYKQINKVGVTDVEYEITDKGSSVGYYINDNKIAYSGIQRCASVEYYIVDDDNPTVLEAFSGFLGIFKPLINTCRDSIITVSDSGVDLFHPDYTISYDGLKVEDPFTLGYSGWKTLSKVLDLDSNTKFRRIGPYIEAYSDNVHLCSMLMSYRENLQSNISKESKEIVSGDFDIERFNAALELQTLSNNTILSYGDGFLDYSGIRFIGSEKPNNTDESVLNPSIQKGLVSWCKASNDPIVITLKDEGVLVAITLLDSNGLQFKCKVKKL
jgi:hypothetical protein